MTFPDKKDKFNHNRKRNSGLIYEFFVRHLASKMIEKDQKEWQKAYIIFEKYFNSKSELYKELQLFNVINSNQGISNSAAQQVISEIQSFAKKLDNKKINIIKSNLLKEINYSLGKDFFSKYRLNEYRVLATIQMYIDGCNNRNQLYENVKKIRLEEALVMFMSSKKKDKQVPLIKEEIDNFVYDVAKNRFQKEYGKVLSNNQKKLIDIYSQSLFLNDSRVLRESLLEEKVRILSVLRNSRNIKEMKEDKIMKSRLDEAITKLEKLNEGEIPEKVIEDMLLFERLSEELISNG